MVADKDQKAVELEKRVNAELEILKKQQAKELEATNPKGLALADWREQHQYELSTYKIVRLDLNADFMAAAEARKALIDAARKVAAGGTDADKKILQDRADAALRNNIMLHNKLSEHSAGKEEAIKL